MRPSKSREKILKKIRTALIEPSPQPFPDVEAAKEFFPPPDEELEVVFAREFTRVDGKFAYCETVDDLLMQVKKIIAQHVPKTLVAPDARIQTWLENNGIATSSPQNARNADIVFSFCEGLIARTGSILVSSRQPAGRRLSVSAPVEVFIAYPSQMFYDIQPALKFIGEKYADDLPSMIGLVTGPSRTADIEKTLVLGAHGPADVYLLLSDEEITE